MYDDSEIDDPTPQATQAQVGLPVHNFSYQEKSTSQPSLTTSSSCYKDYEDEDFYNFSNEKRGIAIIIINDAVQNSDKREGCAKDMMQLQTTFAKFGFEIRCFLDKPKEELMSELKIIAKADHSKSDCLVIAISSHGEEVFGSHNRVREDVINMIDGSVITRVILDLFSDNQCESLKGKPRLIFIQACRGKEGDSGVEVKYRPDPPDFTDCVQHRSPPHFKDLSMQDEVDAKPDSMAEETNRGRYNFDVSRFSMSATFAKKNVQSGQAYLTQDVTDPKKKVHTSPAYLTEAAADILYTRPAPCYKDFLVMYATPPGYYAFRRTSEGSWFISYLCDVLAKQGMRGENLLNVLTRVASKVGLDKESNSTDPDYNKKKQSPVIYSRLTKTVILKWK